MPGSGNIGPTMLTTPTNAPTPNADPRWPSTPGEGRIVVNNVEVPVQITRVDPAIGRTPPAQRTQSDIDRIRSVGEQMLVIVQNAAGARTVIPITLRYTDTGAVFNGLVRDPITGQTEEIPVEDVALLVGGGLVLMVGGISADGVTTDVDFNGVLRLGQGGWIAVLAYGLDPFAPGRAIIMSTPRLIGEFQTDTNGGVSAQAKIPSDLAVGDHTAIVTVGDESASIGFKVVDEAGLPTTGRGTDLAIWSLFGVVFGVIFRRSSVLRRRHALH
jgi:hypothetical protein